MRLYQNLLEDFKEMYLGYAALAIIASSCLGSVAAMMVLMKGNSLLNMGELFIIVAVCMGYNTTVLAQLKPKTVFNSLILSIGVSLLFIIINLF
ncbi:hypothetical protein [Salegentibacter chungangensis]|uniref:Uncharacterized protein n=1 Tax=Salegentibacter chungangensis TaxID=1335724 RepID=A0ABW3NN85_9FLAO